MTASDQKIAAFAFDDFVVDLQNRQLRKAGNPLPLNSKYFNVLVFLIENRGHLVSKQYIFDQIWQDVIVTDWALSQCIKDIRKQLGDDVANPHYIKTIPKHGYAFISQVSEISEEEQITQRSSLISPRRPYKFLDYYQEQDSQIFFGREEEIEKICSKILAHRTFIIHGRSGVGKSSIVRAGLLPHLRKNGHQVFIVRSFTDPFEGMIQALLGSTTGAHSTQSQKSFSELLRLKLEKVGDHAIIFFLDQFEDFFILLGEAEREKFIQNMQVIFQDETNPLKIVFIVREDLLAEMSMLKTALPEIFHHEYRLRRLTREQAILAINEPARVVGCSLEKNLAQSILHDLGEDKEIDPPQIQIICDVLYDERDANNGITIKEYHKLGGASRILTGYLNRVLNRFQSTELQICEEILAALISSNREHLVLKTTDLYEKVGSKLNDNKKLVDDVLQELIQSRIIRARRQDGYSWIELMHDFLVPEILNRISEEERAIMEARALIERAMQNYQAHGLLIDKESLGLILPYGEQLGLNNTESEFIMRSLLQNKFEVPKWLVKRISSYHTILSEMTQHPDPDVRICTIASTQHKQRNSIENDLKNLALWDEDLQVRKTASIALVSQYGSEGIQQLLQREDNGRIVSLKRRAISLAFVRDYQKNLISLSHLPVFLALLVTSGLLWVRISRYKNDILHKSLGGAVGTATAGILVGCILGLTLALARSAPVIELISTVLVLLSLGMLAGMISGFGVSMGMATMQSISYRHSHWWTVIGAALGGTIVGGFVNILGVDTLWALLGQNLSGITGALEGFALGGGTALGTIVVKQQISNHKPWQRILGAAIGAMSMALFLTLIRGNLFSGSIDIIAHAFANSQIKLEPLASIFGEADFGKISRIILGAIEGLLFGSFLVAGMEIAGKRRI